MKREAAIVGRTGALFALIAFFGIAAQAGNGKPLPPIAPEDIPCPAVQPTVILKFDDVKPMKSGRIHPRWTKVAEYLERNGIRAGFGVICAGFEAKNAGPTREWIAERRAKGVVSFWLHGWDHAVWTTADGSRANEMSRRTADEAFERLERCQKLAREQFGFAFRAYGPAGGVGGGSIDAEALKALKRQRDIKVVMYPQPDDEASLAYKGDRELMILDRVWQVNVEGSVGIPDYQRFLHGWAKNLKRKFVVLQSHPAMWDDARFAEFEKIMEFLKGRNVKFMTPEEYYDGVYAK